ncbi:hypothetical protein BJ138DRAFT_1181858 [Hygrophoropsis aurantiaca]|uniref:Uncharacterized protein n=1 Tax=Hygrophoropsis aurantiaca TaxID=72124 RepID=A0ACB8A500_9AGAM|nr:hypothetical protein BJ138DRAFT_1181858 [Hygrophoropsis aurantiaca]
MAALTSTQTTREDQSQHSHSSDDERELARQRPAPQPKARSPSPPKANTDWRGRRTGPGLGPDSTRSSRTLFVPGSARAGTGADGSVGGHARCDQCGAAAQRAAAAHDTGGPVKTEAEDTKTQTQTGTWRCHHHRHRHPHPPPNTKKKKQTTNLAGDDPALSIPIAPTEADAYLQDAEVLPDAAMLRGMGWVKGAVASSSARFKRTGKDREGAGGKGPRSGGRAGMVEPYVPATRPALLGIGARGGERYVPLVKKEGGSKDVGASRQTSRLPKGDRDSRREYERCGCHDDDRSACRKDERDKRDYDGRDRCDDDRDRQRSNDRQRRRDYDDRG